MISIKNKYKDDSPGNTIHRIKNILDKNSIEVVEHPWNQFGEDCFSIRIELKGIPLGTNGKGTSKLYALASAYAEFMERLQTGMLLKENYGKKELSLCFPDTKKFHFNEIPNKEYLFNEFIVGCTNEEYNDFFSNKSSDVRMVPYFNLSSGESVYLPDKLVRKCSGSNGMAAGNTPAEAIVQGISEIIERYVTKKIIFEERLLPEIASSEFESENLIQIIKRIEKSGYLVKIKDCTLGGKFPALGVLVIDPKRNKSHLRFGASPSKEIALERCLTEFFQGFNDNTWHNRFEKMRWGTRKTTEENKWKEFRQTAKDGKGKLPDSLFLPAKKINWLNAFIPESDYISNKVALRFLLELLRDSKLNILIRDFSYLGFPSYHIYIPGITNTTNGIWSNIKMMSNSALQKRNLLNIETLSKEDLKGVSSFLDRQLEEKREDTNFYLTGFLKEMRIKLKPNNPIESIDIRLLNSIIKYQNSDYTEALHALNIYLDSPLVQESDYFEYYQCCAAFFRLKSNGSIGIKRTLQNIYSKKIVKEVLEDLSESNDLFRYLDMPSCPDCKQCSLQEYCLYNAWAEIICKLNSKMTKPIPQTKNFKRLLNEIRKMNAVNTV